jgi:hypothetical protein
MRDVLHNTADPLTREKMLRKPDNIERQFKPPQPKLKAVA